MRHLSICFVVAAAVATAAGPTASAAAASAGAAAGSYKVIANPGVAAATLPREDVARLFLKKTPKWPGTAVAVVPVDQDAGSATRDAFSREVFGKPATAIVSYWQQQIFSGRGVPPVQKGGDDEVTAFVRATPGAIGYVSRSAAAVGVKVVVVGS